MSAIADSAPTVGGMIVGTLVALYQITTALAKWSQERARKRDMDAVPPTRLAPPGPAVDAAVIERLRHVEAHQQLAAELARREWSMADQDRELAALRAENAQLSTQLKIERAGRGIANELLRAKEERIARLEEDLARARARRPPAARELPPEHEHRDAAVSGELQDAIRTPLRPPAR